MTVAVLVSWPDVAASMSTTTVNVTDEPAARLTVVSMRADFRRARTMHRAPAMQVQLIAVTPAGTGSVTVAPTTFDGPLLDDDDGVGRGATGDRRAR